MKTLSSWDTLLATPAPRDHLVQLYTRDEGLVSTVARFVAHGLTGGEGVVVTTTASHWAKIAKRLATDEIEVTEAQATRQLVVRDAYDTLASFMVDGMPDGSTMRTVIMAALDSVRSAGWTTVRAFGEMVDILNRRGKLAAAIRLEELWNELIDAERIALLCGYAVDPFDRAEYKATLPRISHVHSHMMPVEDGDRLERAIDRAFVDVFGIYGDTRLLRELFVRQLPDATAMPNAQGALFALRELDSRLDTVLERAATHYRGA